MDRESKKLFATANKCYIVNIEIVTTDGIKQLVLDLITKKQKLHSIVLQLLPAGLVSRKALRNSSSTSDILSQYIGLYINDVLMKDGYVLLCTDGDYLRIKLKNAKLTHLSNEDGCNISTLFIVMENGF